MPKCHGVRELAKLEVAGGGQVDVVDGHAYIGHMAAPDGTTVVDVRDPRKPRIVAEIKIPANMHSHKARAGNGIMLVNHELTDLDGAKAAGLKGGLGIYDVSNPSKPKEITKWVCGGRGVHRFTFDGRYAYISPQLEGYVGNILMIVDVSDPTRPEEVSRWWLPGQHVAGGETPSWEGRRHRCHHALRRGVDRLYCSYWHAGFMIFDIADIRKPRLISHVDWSPPYPCPTHTAIPIPHEIKGRKMMVVSDEEVADRLAPTPNAFLWMVDITDETNPVPVSTFGVTLPTRSRSSYSTPEIVLRRR